MNPYTWRHCFYLLLVCTIAVADTPEEQLRFCDRCRKEDLASYKYKVMLQVRCCNDVTIMYRLLAGEILDFVSSVTSRVSALL